ncbi:MAG: hypothetical protein ACK4GD_08015 [Sphingomonadaceae bacterium]
MIARLLVMAALLVPTAAQATEDAAWAGVYEGTIGRYPVTVCLQSWGDGSAIGAYYYHSQLKPIRLSGSGDSSRWIEAREGESWGAQSGPRWTLQGLGSDEVTGTWRDGRRRLPISLKGVLDGGADHDLPCSSAAFMARRVVPAAFDRTEDGVAGFAFTRLAYKPPAHFSDIAITGFTFAPSRPGDAPIVQALAAALPRGVVEDEFVQCVAGSLGSLGIDGSWEQSIAPAFVDDSFLAVETAVGAFCGGAHPNFWSFQTVYDRSSGEEVKLASWLGAAAWGESEYDLTPVSQELRELALKHWPEDSDAECRDAAREQDFWRFGLSADGFNLTPDFPHVLTACEETATVPWPEIEPYLSDEGKAARARMR